MKNRSNLMGRFAQLRAVAFSAISMALLLSQIACSESSSSKTDPAPTAGNSEAVPVAVTVVRSGDIAEIIEATGSVQAMHNATVAAQVSGQVVAVHADLGDAVRKGQALMRIDPEMYQYALDQAEARLLSAKAAYEKAQADFKRNERLHATGDISDYVFENVRLQVESSRAAYEAAMAARKIAAKQLNDCVIRAPFAGEVAQRHVALGNTVAPGMPLYTIVDINQLKVRISLSESDIVRLQKEQEAALRVNAYPERIFSGKITAIGPSAALETRTFPVEITFANSKEHELKAGMVAKVSMTLQHFNDVPLLPSACLLYKQQQPYVFVVQDSTAHERLVELGPQQGEDFGVLNGLRAGEKVVSLGQDRLSSGKAVRIIREE